MKKLLDILAKVLFGKEIALALQILGLVNKTIQSIKKDKTPNVAELTRLAYKQLPEKYKTTATEQESIDFVYKGVEFLKAAHKLAH